MAAALPLLRFTPCGEPHSVLVLPGLLASDWSTTVLRGWLDRLGYRVVGGSWTPPRADAGGRGRPSLGQALALVPAAFPPSRPAPSPGPRRARRPARRPG